MNILILTYGLNAVLMIAMPVGLAVFLARRWKLGWSIWWIGAATFILSQVGHIPFNWAMSLWLNGTGMVYWPPLAQLAFNAVFLGLSAGVFEEGTRWLVLRFWIKKARSWRTGILFGAGHGGVEAILFGILVLASYVSMLVLRSMDLSALVPAGQLELAQQQVAAYWSAPWYATLLGAVERLFAIPCHIALAVMVMQVFTRRKIGWLFAAIGFHALLDAAAVFGQQYLSIYALEGVIGLFAVLSVCIIFLLRQPEPLAKPDPVPLP
ncbi:MAG: hypothetical protein FD146_611 [Anaerolineaceae bacterium]|nr:MAG: hypothetical protein FD146_611 [Anaerolineaceae bacterium]